MVFTDSISVIKGIGGTRQQLLQNVGINLIGDLLSYLPYTYEDSTNIISVSIALELIAATPLWEINSIKVALKATLEKATTIRTRRGLTLITATFYDNTSDLKIKSIWFNQSYLISDLHQGKEYILYGKVQKEGRSFAFQSPKIEEIIPEVPLKKLGGILPIYRRVKSVTTTYIRKYIAEVLPEVDMKEYIPNQLLTRQALPNLKESLHYVHKPSVLGLIPQGYRRLAVQELLELRQEYDEKFVKPRLDKKGSEIAQALGIFIGENLKRLPYTLTKGQQKILQEILESIQKGEYVDSLVYGDVGSGKTIIALLLAFGLAKQGYSTILIAPTTILASQHVRTAQKLHSLFGLGHEVSLREVTARKGKAEGITDSTVYIGTQAIFHNKKLLDDKKVTFVCIDEQHRFGVEQRTLLKKEGRHVLTLSATPIPRTLALSFLGFSEAYFLEDKPLGRKQVISRLVPKDKEQTTYEWIAKHLTNGEQVYVVFPRIESEEESEKQSLLAMSASLITQYFSSFQSALLYGSLKEEEKNRIMSDFSSGKIRILFSTSVIEVGVDVPNATIIAIHGAELFGLAQLHQLRGRVGRSSQQGYCLLFSGSEASEANERLDYFSLHHDGITVSEYDLKHRGTGTLLGKQQSGLSELRMAQVTDLSMVKEAMTLYEELRSEKVAIPRYFRVKSTNE